MAPKPKQVMQPAPMVSKRAVAKTQQDKEADQAKRDQKAQEKEQLRLEKEQLRQARADERKLRQEEQKRLKKQKQDAEDQRKKAELQQQLAELLKKQKTSYLNAEDNLNKSDSDGTVSEDASNADYQAQAEEDLTSESKKKAKEMIEEKKDPTVHMILHNASSASSANQITSKAPSICLAQQWVEQAIRASQPHGKFGTQLNTFVREAFRNADPTVLDGLNKSYYDCVTKPKFKDYILNNKDFPDELTSASPLDLVNMCVYLMNDTQVHEAGPYLLGDVFFKNMYLLKQPLSLPDKYWYNVVSYITPRLWVTKVDCDSESCAVGVELVDLALQYGFFPALIEELKDVLFQKTQLDDLRKTSFNQYPSVRKDRASSNVEYRMLFAMQRRYNRKLYFGAIKLALTQAERFGVDSVLQQFAFLATLVQKQICELIENHCYCTSQLSDQISQIGKALQRKSDLFKLLTSSTNLDNVNDARREVAFADTEHQSQLYQEADQLQELIDTSLKVTAPTKLVPRISLHQLASLSVRLSEMSTELIKKILAQGLDRAISQIEISLAANTESGAMNHPAVQTYVMQKFREHQIPDAVDTRFTKQHVPFLLNAQGSKFRASAYQSLVAKVMSIQTKNVSVQVKSGQGKTFIIMLLAMELRACNKEPLIVLVNDMLYEQFNFDNNLYFPENKLELIELQYLDPNRCRNKFVILDEADHAIDHFATFFDQAAPLGLVSMKTAQQVFMLSATYDSFHRTYLRDIFQIQNTQHFVFKSTHELINGAQFNEVEKTVNQCPDSNAMIKAFEGLLHTQLAKQPVMVFVVDKPQNENAHDQKLKSIAQSLSVPFFVVDSVYTANEVRIQVKEMPKALIRVSCKFCLGLDLKLQKASYVFSLVKDYTMIRVTQLDQMLGRSSRAQGQAQGMIMLCNRDGVTVNIDRIKAQTVIRPTHGILSLAPYYNKVSLIQPATWQLIQAAYNDDDWYTLMPEAFKKKHSDLMKTLEDLT